MPVFNDPNASDDLPRLSVAATAVLGTSFGSLCPPSTGDVRGCTTQSILAGLRLSPRWRLSDGWAVGVSGGMGWLGQSDSVPTRVWDVEFAGRYYLGTPEPSQFWLDAGAGVSALVEDWPTYGNDTGAWFSAHTFTAWAPAGALAFGRDFAILPHFGLAPEIRVQGFAFSADKWLQHAPQHRPQVLVAFGLSVVGFGFSR